MTIGDDKPPSLIAIPAPDGSVAEAIVYPDANALIEGAAEFIVKAAAEAIARNGRFAIALSGGNTPKPVYQRLAALRLDWARVHLFFGDERCVPPDDPRSNYHMVKAALIDHVAIPVENVHRMRGEDNPDAAADAYAKEMKGVLGHDPLDLVLLGLGDNGHTASLFPGLAVVTETKRTVMAAYVEVVGMWRLTLTPPAINVAHRAAFLVSGADKAEIVQRVLQGRCDPIVLPAQVIRPKERPALWLIDAAAAARLKPE
jgi:6-phosphogluconolactonase